MIVIPAHDEEDGIGATIASCRSLSYPPSDYCVQVIADNCGDGTARIAREAGAEVFERHDLDRRAKGYALEDFLRRAVAAKRSVPCDAYVVIDADTVVAADLLERFSEALDEGADWVQGYHTVRNPDASWRTRLMTYAFSLFNGVWLLGLDRLGLSVGLRGNGMCFSAQGLSRFPCDSHGLAEDLEFSWRLRVAGERVRFWPAARVFSEMVSRGRAAVSQRRRWEEGRRQLPAEFRGPLLRSMKIGCFQKLVGLAELYFPPLTKLLVLLVAACSIHLAAVAFPSLVPAARLQQPLHIFMVLTTAVYAISPFLCMGLPVRSAWGLAALPYFVVWKSVVTARGKTTAWLRTQREPPVARESA
jgi:cellulose synthase/poly-beta-1,6-N-acetylglucosamine synthase-like glycosyltransferase